MSKRDVRARLGAALRIENFDALLDVLRKHEEVPIRCTAGGKP